MPRDPYDVLGLTKSATAGDIQKAYRKLSKKYHPDRNPGDKQADASYKEVQAAYELLSDPEKKAQFDTYGAAGPMPGGGGFPGGFPGGGFPGGFPGGADHGGFEMDPQVMDFLRRHVAGGGAADYADAMAGRRAKTRGRGRQTATEAEITVALDVVAQGGVRTLTVDGTRIDVKIPAGIPDGQKLLIPAKATGSVDVILKVNVAPHAYFRRDGKDLYLDVPLGLAEAVLGATVEVPALDGTRLDVKVPPGTSSGAKLRLRGKGLAGGDQFLVFQVKVPGGAPDDESRKLIEQYAAKNPQTPRANVAWG
jgi:curved DNA-binding protein